MYRTIGVGDGVARPRRHMINCVVKEDIGIGGLKEDKSGDGAKMVADDLLWRPLKVIAKNLKSSFYISMFREGRAFPTIVT